MERGKKRSYNVMDDELVIYEFSEIEIQNLKIAAEKRLTFFGVENLDDNTKVSGLHLLSFPSSHSLVPPWLFFYNLAVVKFRFKSFFEPAKLSMIDDASVSETDFLHRHSSKSKHGENIIVVGPYFQGANEYMAAPGVLRIREDYMQQQTRVQQLLVHLISRFSSRLYWFLEIHGDRAGYDDLAIVSGLGTTNGRTYMFIGHQKGRHTKENTMRNFGMPTPHGYRKALRMMEYADHHGSPIITFIDTSGAFVDIKSEEIGQGDAIAKNLESMFVLKVPIVTVIIGEGGPGGALAIACPNKGSVHGAPGCTTSPS
ncbi:hypothetical protein OROHE_026846 [Orobanche hederae]